MGVAVHGRQCRQMDRKRQPEVRSAQFVGRLDHVRGHAVEGGERVARGEEHVVALAVPDLIAVVGQGWQSACRCVGLEVGDGGADGGPGVSAAGQQQYARLVGDPVQKRVAEQPREVGHRPPVGIVDDQEHTGPGVGAQVLAPGWRVGDAGAAHGRCHGPAGGLRILRELCGQSALALAARRVQPLHRQPWTVIAPATQIGKFLLAPGEVDDRVPRIQHAAGQVQQPGRVRPGIGAPTLKDVQRHAIAEHVDVRADAAVGKTVDRLHVLLLGGAQRLSPVGGVSRSRWTMTLLPGPCAPTANPPSRASMRWTHCCRAGGSCCRIAPTRVRSSAAARG